MQEPVLIATPIDEPITVIITGDCDCPICGALEVANPDDPIESQRLQVRAHKVFNHGLWWSECLACKAVDGNGWFAIEESGAVVIKPSRIATMRAKGRTVEEVPPPAES